MRGSSAEVKQYCFNQRMQTLCIIPCIVSRLHTTISHAYSTTLRLIYECTSPYMDIITMNFICHDLLDKI